MADLTAADVLALKDNDGMFGGMGGIFGIFVLFILFGMLGGGFGWGGNNAAAQNALTRAELCDGFNTAQIERNQSDLMRGQFGLQADVFQNRYDSAVAFGNARYDTAMGFANTQNAMQQGFCGTQKEILENRYANQLAFNTMQAQLAQCCCDLKTSIHGEAETTRALIRDTNEQALRDQIQGLRDERTVLQNQLGRQAQTASIISELLPQPKPMYPATSPYQAVPVQAIPYQMPTYAPACSAACC